MKGMMFFLLTILIFPVFASSQAELSYEGKKVELRFDEGQKTYLSSNCPSARKCFLNKTIELKFYPDQSPGFTLCGQLGGEAFFGEVTGVNEKIPFCKKGGFFIDHEALLLEYRNIKYPGSKK